MEGFGLYTTYTAGITIPQLTLLQLAHVPQVMISQSLTDERTIEKKHPL